MKRILRPLRDLDGGLPIYLDEILAVFDFDTFEKEFKKHPELMAKVEPVVS